MRFVIAAITALALTQGPVAAQQGTTLSGTFTADQMRAIAADAVNAGYTAQAAAITQRLLERDPNDLNALLIASRAAKEMGRAKDSQTFARRAWKLADEDVEKYAASLAMAQALAAQERRSLAQLWLRRAAQHAHSPQAKQRALQDFRLVKFQNPWTTTLSFNVAPTSNLNGGSSNATFKIEGLPEFTLQGTALALSGTEISGGVTTRFNFAETQTARWVLSAGISHRTYQLSSEAKKTAPTAKGSDFASTSLIFGLNHDRIVSDAGAEIGLSSGLAQTWYAGKPLTRSLTLGLNGTLPLTSGNRVTGSLDHQWQQGLNGRKDARILTSEAGFVTKIGQNTLRYALSGTRSRSDASFMDYSDVEISARLSLGKPIKSTYLSFEAARGYRHYDATPYSAGPREDFRTTFGATATMAGIEYYGFVPSVTLKHSVTDSNIGLYNSDETGVFMGIRSAF
ncbi:surface lipoprotein assembly modifier [Pseudoprimorskyibacter insulae]|uniref:DUF560 domain-containing protein n=1 Tax=Pseudoprimorskyibacter insulae TaxID=1695997 RepID=A0A2R8AQ03_9RHOB|nr:surface lipoprotein assembly modifier [Pseudoprimorskyibacter insulae]SPF78060.1 hypothetical protein PRI8871_00649 [Pseudoprimorskyibacter insulae]